jgi:ectoine hydroxylase-related dioxygenase (phytanoyl-CoA dioxygenase family)
MLSDREKDFYRDNGYVLVKGLLPRSEVGAYREAAHEVLIRRNRLESNSTWDSALDLTGGRPTQIRLCHDVQFYSGLFSRLILDERFTSVAADTIGGPNVQLHHTKLFVKPPEKGSPFPMHQDHPWFPHENHAVAAAIFHLDDAPEERGCVRVVPGSQKRGPLEHSSEGGWHLPFDEWPLSSSVACEAEAGDVLFFSYLTVHGSGLNVSPEARTTVLVQYRDPSDRPRTDRHTGSRGQGMMLRGYDPGELQAAS